MKINTRISKITENDVVIRGKKLSELIEKNSFTDAIFLLIRGKEPNQKESKIFSSILISIVDHGAATSSSLVTRITTSTGNDMNTAVAAGVSALGNYHGGAIEKAMNQLSEISNVEDYVSKCLEEKKTLYGFGHKIYKEFDPRTKQILKICEETEYSSDFVKEAIKVEKTLKENGKNLVLNVDGIIAAILLEMGFTPDQGKGIFIIGRVPGLVAQSHEEKQEKPVRRLNEEDINYIGD